MSAALRNFVTALRPRQWTKNALVFAALLFAYGDAQQRVTTESVWVVALAALCFCLASSGVYLINDVHDREADRLHPQKKHRPVAAGRVSPAAAVLGGGLLAAAAIGGGLALDRGLAGVLAGYLALQLAYTFGLKRLAMIDVFVIAVGFVLRAIAGALVIHVPISPWLLVCTFLLAMFLGLCKRRQEFVNVAQEAAQATRHSLAAYSERLLDQLIGITASSTLVCYTIYTLSSDTVQKFGDARLGFTLPFVMFGIFRYLYLVYRRDLGERPEQVLLTDAPILVNALLYGICVLLLLR